MSRKLFSLNDDLRRLREDGYSVHEQSNLLLMRGIPYVNREKRVCIGTLISPLDLAGNITRKPESHVVQFDGDFPCDVNGVKLAIGSEGQRHEVAPGIYAQHSFSQKPEGGYSDYYEKMTIYAAMLTAPARVLDPAIKPRQYAGRETEDPESIFEYMDTASGRAGTGILAERLAADSLAIIGLGGTGSYILDLTAKTPVKEIRLFDGDEFLNHNAFRAPGAPSLDELREAPKKVDHFKAIYSRMHRGITAHPVKLGSHNLHLLDGVTFAFISMDDGPEKLAVIEKLEALGAFFIDVGMGLTLEDQSLGGILRLTVSTPDRRDVVRKKLSFASKEDDGLYDSNIQIADLNCFNATLAVIRWKRLRSFYRDLERELHATYTTDCNLLLGGEPA